MNRRIITRKQAIEELVERYYTGKPCKRGHVAERVTLTAACVECICTVRRDLKARFDAKRAEQYANASEG